MPNAHVPADPRDRITGLPRLSAALADIPELMRERRPGSALGVISFLVPPSPALYRLTPEAARRLRLDISGELAGLLRPSDRLYSVSQWEWLAVLPGLVSPAALPLANLKISRACSRVFETLDGNPLLLRPACGAAAWSAEENNAMHLVQSARIARLHAQGRDSGSEVYTPDMEEVDSGQHRLLQEMQDILHSGEAGMALHLQPQVRLPGGRCVGAEALLRWQLKSGEWMQPLHALAVVARFGLGKSFNRWLLQQAVQARMALLEAGIDIQLSLNLSASDLLDPELPDLVAQALATWGLDAGRFTLEITETVMVEETEQVAEVLRRLRELGVKLSIDDFGTGYSGMSYLQRLPVQEIKIDQSFVRQAPGSPRDREIMASIVQLAHRLGMHLVAEGVESEEIQELVTRLGCEFGQGYLYSPALPVADFIAWYKARS